MLNTKLMSDIKPLEVCMIEKYIMPECPPEGISTKSFSQCPHWVISQYCLGHPQIVKPKKDSRFQLIITEQEISSKGKYVVEVHPALAIWLWLKDDKEINWTYKKVQRK